MNGSVSAVGNIFNLQLADPETGGKEQKSAGRLEIIVLTGGPVSALHIVPKGAASIRMQLLSTCSVCLKCAFPAGGSP